MQKHTNKIQILAPAGSVEQLKAAVNNGCDAVYLGLDSFNARMKAPNFNLNNLNEWVDYCHLFGVKAYVTINTSLKNHEFSRAVKLLFESYKRNVDGVIVTDIALMRIAGALPKPFEVIASTQLNVHDKYGAEFVKKCGATSVVCARECSFEQIKEIASSGLDVECFLHGAMCVCQSGQCLFSSIVGGNSGNRGLCAQPCRKYYFVDGVDNAGGYMLSARDICSLESMRQLADVGSITFKIEGRNRRPEYAGMASRIYRKLADNSFKPSDCDYEMLAEMFNRSMSVNNYLDGGNSEIIYPFAQNHMGVEVGIVKGGGVAAFKELHKGDGLKVFDAAAEVCGGIALDDGKGFIKGHFAEKVADGMKVCRTTSVKLCEEVLSCRRKLDVDIRFEARIGKYPKIIARHNGVWVESYGDFITQQANNAPLDREEIAKQLRKSGETCYTICNIDIIVDDIFIAKSQINALRRNILDKLSSKIIDEYNKRFDGRSKANLSVDSISDTSDLELPIDIKRRRKATCLATICYNKEQLEIASLKSDRCIYKPNTIDGQSLAAAIKSDAYVELPSFADLNYVKNLLPNSALKVVCNNIGQIEFARANNLKYIAGRGLNLFNDYMISQFNDSDTFIYSIELSLKEIGTLKNDGGLVFVDGEIALMQLCHCPYKAVFACDCASCQSDKRLVYRDEMNNRFIVRRRQAGRCLFELINGKKLSVASKLKSKGRYLVDYDDKVINHYVNLNNGICDEYTEANPYTKGRLFDKIN